jgi:hypothetical protein
VGLAWRSGSFAPAIAAAPRPVGAVPSPSRAPLPAPPTRATRRRRAAGLSGTLPASLGRLRNLWLIDITGTSFTCSGILPPNLFTPGVEPPPGVEPACPLPSWLRFSEEYYFQPNMLECPGITFT